MGAYKASINDNVLTELMLDKIVGNLNSTSLVIAENSWISTSNPKISKQPTESNISVVVVARALSSASALD
jgi:hypothetical protein